VPESRELSTSDWLALCRDAVADVRTVLERLSGRDAREPVVGTGIGGDETTAIDEAAERAVVDRIRGTVGEFTLVSEELGELRVGTGGPRIVLDPIDGSLNAKRALPFFSVSVAVADGPTMADVHFGYVYDFGSGEEWTAVRGGGAYLDGNVLDGDGPKEELEIVAFEATTTAAIVERVPAMVGLAYRLRIMGSLALALCQLAAGRLDGVCSLKAARSVDIAAAQLLVRERGLAIELPGAPPFADAPLDLVARSPVAAAGTTTLCRKLADALSA
jgi:myo-inositol-1(or 4)-monophosphatase